MERKRASDFDPRALVAYDDFAHGRISRASSRSGLPGLRQLGLAQKR